MASNRFGRRAVLGVAAALALGIAPLTASADVDFSGKTVEWIIPFKEGGGSDKWSRFYAPLLSEALPGNPNVVVKNVPGAGSTKGANFFAQRAKANGLTILGTSGSTQFPFLLDDPRVRYDYADWNIVLATATGGVAYLPKDLAARWAADPMDVIQNVDFIYGSQGATRLDLVPLLAWEMLGMKVEPVFGIKGRGAGRLMFDRVVPALNRRAGREPGERVTFVRLKWLIGDGVVQYRLDQRPGPRMTDRGRCPHPV